jgi:glycosyltransferase involved in cell wall biosynthesis
MVTTFYPPYHFGGDATYVRALSRALVRRGHEVTVIHCEDAYALRGADVDDAAPVDDGVRVLRLKSSLGALSPLVTQQLGVPGLKSRQLRAWLDEDFDVVNFHNVSLVGGPGVLSLSRAPVTLYTLHEHWLLCPTHIFWKNRVKPCDSRQCVRCSLRSGIPPQFWRYGSLIERSLASVDCFLSPSQYTARRHAEQLPVGDRTVVLPLFAMMSPPAPEQNPEASGRFLYVGRLTPAKGIQELLESFSKWPQFTLDVIGDGELGSALRSRYAALPNIRFLGAVPQEELVRHYQAATALVMPSLAPETFGLTIVEAFACGTPAIVKVAGGNREAIDASGAGRLYEDEAGLFAALEALAHDSDARRHLGALARTAYESRYTEERHLQDYLANVEIVQQRKENATRLR